MGTRLTVDFQIPLFFLGVFGNINVVDVEVHAQLLEGNVYFMTVWRGARIAAMNLRQEHCWLLCFTLMTYRSISVFVAISQNKSK